MQPSKSVIKRLLLHGYCLSTYSLGLRKERKLNASPAISKTTKPNSPPWRIGIAVNITEIAHICGTFLQFPHPNDPTTAHNQTIYLLFSACLPTLIPFSYVLVLWELLRTNVWFVHFIEWWTHVPLPLNKQPEGHILDNTHHFTNMFHCGQVKR